MRNLSYSYVDLFYNNIYY